MYQLKTTNSTLTVRPEMHEVMQEVFLKRPSLRYVEMDTIDIEGTKYIDKVSVYDGVDYVGTFSYEKYRPYRGESKVMFLLYSPYIRKDRAPSDTILTINKKSAVRTLLNEELFKKRGEDKTIESLLSKAEYEIDYFIRHKHYDFKQIPHEATMLSFVRKCITENSVNLDGWDEIKQSLDNSKNQEAMVELEVLKSVRKYIENKDFHVLTIRIDDSMVVYHAKTGAEIYKGNSTYELPEWMQSKYAILKNVENQKVVRNMGFKVEYQPSNQPASTLYVIVDGEIPDLIE